MIALVNRAKRRGRSSTTTADQRRKRVEKTARHLHVDLAKDGESNLQAVAWKALSSLEQIRIVKHIHRLACSSTWFDHAIKEMLIQGFKPGHAARDTIATMKLHDIYPPQGAAKPMRRCGDPECTNQLMPAHLIRSDGKCEDCHLRRWYDKYLEFFGENKNCAVSDQPEPLYEGLTAPPAVITKLKHWGLTLKEIAVFARFCERDDRTGERKYSQREIAELCDLSKTGVHFLIKSAMTKIQAAGVMIIFPSDGSGPQFHPINTSENVEVREQVVA
jgi:hypothetical protein